MSFLYPDTATIKQHGGKTQNAEGTLIRSPQVTYRTDAPCDLQIASNNGYQRLEFGETGSQHTHIVFIKPDPNVVRTNLITVNGKTTYEILGVEPFSDHYELYVNEWVT